MGSWGTGLYQDDTAADLKNTIALLSKLPASGERLLEILLEHHHEAVGLDDAGGPTFWLVVADQFERRGILCPRAFEQALAAVETGADLRDFEARGTSAGDLKKRVKVLDALAGRLRSPRPPRPRPNSTKPPPFVVEVGDVYRFPTMKGRAFNPWSSTHQAAAFKPDGWGALLIVARGRVFEWVPWCALESLTVPASREPSLEDAARARFISKAGAGICVPRRTHLQRIQMELLGCLDLDPKRAAGVIERKYSPEYAVLAGWSFVPQARAWGATAEDGTAVRELLSHP